MAPQFSREQRNFLVMEYHKQKGHRDFLPQLVTLFQNKFPGARAPSFSAIRRVYRKQMLNGTVNSCLFFLNEQSNFCVFWCQYRVEGVVLEKKFTLMTPIKIESYLLGTIFSPFMKFLGQKVPKERFF